MSNKRKKFGKDDDFKKSKLKVGKTRPKPSHHTNIEVSSKALVMPTQMALQGETKSSLHQVCLNSKNMSMKEILSKLFHHNTNIRKDAFDGLLEILKMYPSLSKVHFLSIIRACHKLMLDDSKIIRSLVLEKMPLRDLFDENKNIEPFEDEIVLTLHAILTHVKEPIRLDGLKYFMLWFPYIKYGILKNRSSFMMVVARILSNGASLESSGKKFYASINSDPSDKISSLEWRLLSLSALEMILTDLIQVQNSHNLSSSSNLLSERPGWKGCWISLGSQKAPLELDLFSNSHSSSSLSEKNFMTDISEFTVICFPLLVQCWIESFTKVTVLDDSSTTVMVHILRCMSSLLFDHGGANLSTDFMLQTRSILEKHIFSQFPMSSLSSHEKTINLLISKIQFWFCQANGESDTFESSADFVTEMIKSGTFMDRNGVNNDFLKVLENLLLYNPSDIEMTLIENLLEAKPKSAKKKFIYGFLLDAYLQGKIPSLSGKFLDIVPIVMWELGSEGENMAELENLISNSLIYLKASFLQGCDVSENKLAPVFSVHVRKKGKRLFGTFHRIKDLRLKHKILSILYFIPNITENLLHSVSQSLVKENDPSLTQHAISILIGRVKSDQISLSHFLSFLFSCMLLVSSSDGKDLTWLKGKSEIISICSKSLLDLIPKEDIQRLFHTFSTQIMEPVVFEIVRVTFVKFDIFKDDSLLIKEILENALLILQKESHLCPLFNDLLSFIQDKEISSGLESKTESLFNQYPTLFKLYNR